MEFYRELSVDFENAGPRGRLVQLVHDGYRQVNVLYSKKGAKRGGHYHKVSSEAFYVISGSVEATLRRGGGQSTVIFQEGDFFLLEPGVIHSMSFPEDCVMLALYDVPVEREDGTKDIYTDFS